MKEEHFIKVYCSQELPKEEGSYLTRYGERNYCPKGTDGYYPNQWWDITWWLKSIDLEQVKAENDQYKKAIAEQAIDYQKTIDKLDAEIERLKELG